MARLAAALWSLCVTAVLVASATQGRCCGPRLHCSAGTGGGTCDYIFPLSLAEA